MKMIRNNTTGPHLLWTLLLAALLVLAVPVIATAQDNGETGEPEETEETEETRGAVPAPELGEDAPEFVRGIFELMAQEGWTGRELAAFVTASRARNWEEVEDVEPELVMNAMRLARQEGRGDEDTDDDTVSPDGQAELALQLALEAREMRSLGMDRREIAQATANATRETLRTMTRDRIDMAGPEVGQQIRDRVREAAGREMQDAARDRMREDTPGQDNAARRGGADGRPGAGAGGPSSGGSDDPTSRENLPGRR
jgi:hypothetical protein